MTHINQAITDIEEQIETLEDSISETNEKLSRLRKAKTLLESGMDVLNGTTSYAAINKPPVRVVRKREMSDEARKKISERMAARWAAKRGEAPAPDTAPVVESAPEPANGESPAVEEASPASLLEETTPKRGSRLVRKVVSMEQ